VLSELVRTLVEVGEAKRAEAAVRSIPDPDDRAEASRGLLRAPAEAGRTEQAETDVRSALASSEQAWTSAPLVEKTDPRSFRRLLAAAPVDTPPTALLEVMARVDPQAVADTAHHVIAAGRES